MMISGTAKPCWVSTASQIGLGDRERFTYIIDRLSSIGYGVRTRSGAIAAVLIALEAKLHIATAREASVSIC